MESGDKLSVRIYSTDTAGWFMQAESAFSVMSVVFKNKTDLYRLIPPPHGKNETAYFSFSYLDFNLLGCGVCATLENCQRPLDSAQT